MISSELKTDSESPTQSLFRKNAQIVLTIVVVLFSLHLINSLSKNPEDFQWDFKSYYLAATVHAQDKDPYLKENLTKEAGHEILFGYYYNPILLWFFKPFTLFSLNIALQIWLFLKLFVIAINIYIWRKWFVPDIPLGAFALFLLMAFDAAIYWDFKAGNVSIIEQLLLWAGFLAFIRGKLIPFIIFVILASLMKIAPLFFFVLIPLSDLKNKWWYGLGALFASVTVYTGIYLIDPDLFRSFIGGLGSIYESAKDFNYSTLALIDYFQKNAVALPLGEPPAMITYVIYSLVVLIFASVTYWFMQIRYRLLPSIDRKLLIIIACLVYAIILPRFKCYSYTILIIPSLYIIREYFASKASPYLIFLFLLPVAFPLPADRIWRFLSTLYPLYLAYFVWVLCLIKLKTMRDAELRLQNDLNNSSS